MGEDKDGWASDSSPDGYREYSSSGRGAVTGGAPKEAGAGNSGGGRGSDYPVAGQDAEHEGEARPEFPPQGWGEAGGNYPPALGPNDGG